MDSRSRYDKGRQKKTHISIASSGMNGLLCTMSMPCGTA